MRARRVVCVLWLAGVVGCDGPVLQAGTYLRELDGSEASDDAEASDARVAPSDAGRPRDAQQSDARFPWNPEPCNSQRDCDNNFRNDLCNPWAGVCVECIDDRDCDNPGRCNEEIGQCREPEKPRP